MLVSQKYASPSSARFDVERFLFMLSFASVPSRFYLLSLQLISRVQPMCFLLNICLLYIPLYPLCYIMYSPTTIEPNRYRIVESSSCLWVLKGLERFERLVFYRMLSILYISYKHTHTHIHAYTQYGHAAKLFRHCIAKTCTNAYSLQRTSQRCCTARLGTVLNENLFDNLH